MDGSKLSLSDATRFSTYMVHEQMLGIQMEYGKLVLKSGDMPAYQFRLQAGDIEVRPEVGWPSRNCRIGMRSLSRQLRSWPHG